MVLIATWNVNSVNARLHHLQDFCKLKRPDVLLLQEIKCIDEKFPFEAVEELGYNVKVYGQKSYNGVAILSKHAIEDVLIGLPCLSDIWPKEARYIEAFISFPNFPLRIASVYVPNGFDVDSNKFLYKLDFIKALKDHLTIASSQYDYLLVGGDLNVAPEAIDVHSPQALNGSIGFHIKERDSLREIINNGLLDLFRVSHPAMQQFTWWDYRGGSLNQNKGMRIDHFLGSASAANRLTNVEIFKEARSWDKPSDHAPVLCQFK